MNWNDWHSAKDAQAPNEHLVRFASKWKDRSMVLDIGSGNGCNASFLVTQGHLVHCIDASIQAVEKASMRLTALGKWAKPYWAAMLQKIDDQSCPETGSYDVAIDICTLQHVDDLDMALRKTYGQLAKNGTFYTIFASDETTYRSDVEFAHTTFIRRDELVRRLKDAKFGIVSVERVERTLMNGQYRVVHWIVEAVK